MTNKVNNLRPNLIKILKGSGIPEDQWYKVHIQCIAKNSGDKNFQVTEFKLLAEPVGDKIYVHEI